MGKKKQIIFNTTDYFGNFVILDEYAWQHVMEPIEGHPEMTGFEDDVCTLIQNPAEIRVSRWTNTGLAFISSPGIGPSPEGIRVIVAYSSSHYEKGSTRGRVTTAYPIDILKYGTRGLGKTIYKRGG